MEADGSVAGSFDSPQAAAQSLARGEVGFPGLARPGEGVPADLGGWTRGDLPPLWPTRPPSARPRILDS